MSIFDDEDKIYVSFSIRGHGKNYTVNSEYEDHIQWSEVLDDVVKTLEASWGYTFDLPNHIGIHYTGKSDD